MYFAAALALSLILAPSLTRLVRDSRDAEDLRNVDGLVSVIDELRPGMTVNLTFVGNGGDSVVLGAHGVSCPTVNGSGPFPTKWPLQDAILEPGLRNTLLLEGGQVQVETIG